MRNTKSALPMFALLLVACVTINVYFPEAAIKDLSAQIEEEVRREAAGEEAGAEPAPSEAPQPEPERKVGLLRELLGVGVAYAAEQQVSAPEVTNPAIRKIIASRAARLDALTKHKADGVLGENNQALVDIRNLDAVSDLRERAEVQRLVREENADREALFKEIAAAKGVDLALLPRIRETYAETIRNDARPGDWIQLPDGTWKQK